MINIDQLNIAYDRVLIKDGKLDIPEHSVTLIKGLSGSGKSTLLYRIGLINSDTSYSYHLDHTDMMKLSQNEKDIFRCYHVGYVMQDFCLFEQYDILGNLQLYTSFIQNSPCTDKEYEKLLELVQLDVPLHQRIETLSGGERQRLAIACALCKKPDILILDEPTSALDRQNEEIVFSVLHELAHKYGKYIIIASHSPHAQAYADQIYVIENQGLICKKTYKNQSQHEALFIKKEKKYTLHFYWNYIRYFMKKFQGLNITIMMIMAAVLLMTMVCSIYVDNYAKSSEDAITKLSDRLIFVTDSKKHVHINETLDVIGKERVTQLQDMVSKPALHPFVPITSLLYGNMVYVIPYYNESELTEKILQRYDLSNTKGVYLSYDLFADMNKNGNMIDKLQINCDIHTYVNKQELVYQKQVNKLVKGVLKKNVKSSYINDESKFIYMYYKDIEKLYHAVSNSNQFVGYSLEFHNFDHMFDVNKKLLKMDIGVNDGFIDMNKINTMRKTITFIRSIVVGSVISICMLLLSAVSINYFYKRNREFALLKINGLANNEFIKLTAIETITKAFCAFCLVSILSFIVWELSHVFQMQLPAFQLSYFILLCLINGIVITLVSMLFTYIYLKRMTPENILRN